MKDNTINYSSKNHNRYLDFLHVFFPSCFVFFLFCLSVLASCKPLKNKAVAQGATLGCPAQLVWCSPAGLCSQGSGTGPDAYTYLSKCSRNCQNFARSSVPVEQIGINESQRREKFLRYLWYNKQETGKWYILGKDCIAHHNCTGKSNKEIMRFLNCPGYSIHHEMDKLTNKKKHVLWVHALWWISCVWVYQHWY